MATHQDSSEMGNKDLEQANPPLVELTPTHLNMVAEEGHGYNLDSQTKMFQILNQLTLVVNTAVKDIAELKGIVVDHYASNFQELKTSVLQQKESIGIIQDSIKMIEVVMCSSDFGAKSMNPNAVAKTCLPRQNVINLSNENNVGEAEKIDVNGKRKCIDNDGETDTAKIIENYDLTFSDDEDDVLMNKRLCQTINSITYENTQSTPNPFIPEVWTKPTALNKSDDFYNAMSFSKSNFKRSSSKIDGNKEGVIEISKKLFPSPSPNSNARGQLQKTSNRGATSSRGRKTTKGSASGSKRMSSLLPKGIKWSFPVTSDMELDLLELQMIAYVYHPDKDKEKKLVSCGGIDGYRADFDSLVPGKRVNQKMITLVCRRATWVHQHYSEATVWYLPPAFADDVLLLGRPLYQMLDRYCKEWMEPLPRLKYRGIVYQLDSFCKVEDIAPRRESMLTLCKTLQEMVYSSFYGTTYLGSSVMFSEWPMEEARGIPNVGHSENAAVWLMEWLDMDHCFTPNLQGEMDETKVRLRTATRMLLGMHNELRDVVTNEAKTSWEYLQP